MPCVLDGKKIIPAPFAQIRRETIVREDGTPLGGVYAITLKGKIVAWKGSPNSAGVFWDQPDYPPDENIPAESRLGAVLKKQQALIALFKNEGRALEITPLDGTAPLKCYPRFKGIEFQEGLWFETCEFQVTLEADWITGLTMQEDAADARVSKVTSEWNLEVLDEAKGTYRLTHALSATGRRVFDETGSLLGGKQAWENARDYVLNQNFGNAGLGLGLAAARMSAPGVLDANSLQAFNYVRTQAVHESAGVFSATESWVCYDPQGQPPAVNDYNVSLHYSSQDNRTNVTVEGTVSGLEVRDNATHALVSTRWANAQSKWNAYVFPNLFSTAQNLVGSGVPLNTVPLANQVGLNPVAGTVTYRWEYDNRPTPSVPGAITERVTVVNNNAADVFAQLPALGRPVGPVLQGTGTVTSKKRTISIDILMPASTQTFSSASPNTAGIVTALMPVSPLGVFLEQDEESWTPREGRYTRSTVFVWE